MYHYICLQKSLKRHYKRFSALLYKKGFFDFTFWFFWFFSIYTKFWLKYHQKKQVNATEKAAENYTSLSEEKKSR